MSAADIPIREIYKVYNQHGVYLGILPTPTTILKIPQDINSLGSQISLNIPVSADTSKLATDVYTTEDGSTNYTDETGSNNYVNMGQIPIVSAGIQSTDTLIKNGNTVQAWIYNYFYPNGKCMFIGKIRRWEADFGSDNADGDSINILLYSTGYDLDNYLVYGTTSFTPDQSQTVQNTFINGPFSIGGNNLTYWGQTITVGTGITNIGALEFMLKSTDGSSQSPTVYIWNSVADAQAGVAPLATATNTFSSTTPTAYLFALSAPLAVTPGNSYYIAVDILPKVGVYINTAAHTYAGGPAVAVGSGVSYVFSGNDTYFVTLWASLSTATTFTNQDPSIMLRMLLSDYIDRGGSQRFNLSTVDSTGLSLTYTFHVQTEYDALRAILSLAPDGFYYYLDLGTQLLYFKNQSVTADFIFTKGVEINALKLINTTENSKNQLFFTGGDTGGGVNLYKQYNDTQSIGAFGPLLDLKTDSRVTLGPTADAIGFSEMAELAGEQYQTTITIMHTTKLDITLLVPGKTVAFRGYGTFVDNIITQIVHREWTAESVILTLGILPARLSYQYENTTRQLIASQTQDNPAGPS